MKAAIKGKIVFCIQFIRMEETTCISINESFFYKKKHTKEEIDKFLQNDEWFIKWVSKQWVGEWMSKLASDWIGKWIILWMT